MKMNKPCPGWRDILDYSKHYHWGTIERFAKIAVLAHYRYFLWNDRVYEITDPKNLCGETVPMTEWTIKDIPKVPIMPDSLSSTQKSVSWEEWALKSR
jgi:hypothetical protein